MSNIVRFGLFEADFSSGQLSRRGVRIKLRHQSFQVLQALLEHPGKTVNRDELRQRLWNDNVIVDFENNLNTAVAQLREALCDSSEKPRYIETVPRRGYRFVGDAFIPPAEAESPRTRARLVVLPFLNLSGDPAQDYFSDAVTDEIITSLASVAPEKLAVIARTTAMHYKGSRKDIARIARELNVDYVVEGGVSRTSDRVGVNIQLIATRDETHLFSKKYEAEMVDVFSLYDSIAEALARHLPIFSDRMNRNTLNPGQIRSKPTHDLTAYNEFIQGRFEMGKWTPEGVAKAKMHFEAALAHDPEFALACDALAELYWYLGFWGFMPSKVSDRIGRFYVLRALEIDPSLAETYALLSCYPKQLQPDQDLRYFDWPVQQKDAAHARKLNPASPLVRLRFAIIEMILGRTDEAVTELEMALETDPLSPDLRAWSAQMLCLGRHNDRALEQAHQLVELYPVNPMAHSILGFVLNALQRYEESIASLRKAVELSGGDAPAVLGWLGLSLGLGRHTDEARAIVERLKYMATLRYIPPTSFAWTYLGLGDIDSAFSWMDRAVDTPDRMMAAIKTYPFLDPIRADPRFAVLLQRMNLEAC